MGSSRLPGKVLMYLEGEIVLGRVLARLAECDIDLGKIVVATSTLREDNPIVSYCLARGTDYVRGPAFNVLKRFAQAHDLFGGDPVVRVTADCPLLDPALLGDVVRLLLIGEHDYVGVRRVPAGYDCEAFTAEALHAANRWATLPEDLEHVVPWMWRNTDCGWVNAEITGDPVELNTAADLERLRSLV